MEHGGVVEAATRSRAAWPVCAARGGRRRRCRGGAPSSSSASAAGEDGDAAEGVARSAGVVAHELELAWPDSAHNMFVVMTKRKRKK